MRRTAQNEPMIDLSPHGLDRLLAESVRVATAAGDMAMRYFRPGAATSARIWSKDGGSPVTEADIAVDNFLKARCGDIVPAARWLSEETVDDPARLGHRLVWVVDPIDGTRAFMAGLPDWGVCVALLADNQPVLGVVHAPALEATYAASLGRGATRNAGEIRARSLHEGPPRIAGPKPMLEVLAKVYAFDAQPKVPSLALRLARIAEGSLDGGLISPDSRDWDLAAADLILSEAGGTVTTLAGERLVFNRARPVHATLVAAGHGGHPALLAAANAMRDHAFSRN